MSNEIIENITNEQSSKIIVPEQNGHVHQREPCSSKPQFLTIPEFDEQMSHTSTADYHEPVPKHPRRSASGLIVPDLQVNFDLYDDNPAGSTDYGSSGDTNIEGSRRSFSKNFTKRASQIILEVPVAHLKKIKEAKSIGSLGRETQTFVGITTLHGPLRMYRGKRHTFYFWAIMFVLSFVLLMWQFTSLLIMYLRSPTVSQVSFLINDNGMDFPDITVCNLNPVRRSYIRQLNNTGDFSDTLLTYLMQSNMDTQELFGDADRVELHVGEQSLRLYQASHPDFTINSFFNDGGFACEDIMKMCSFAGRQFLCCKTMTPILTNLGKCYTMALQTADQDWLRKQTEAGKPAGLQLLLDTHIAEQYEDPDEDADDGSEPLVANMFETGYRYFIHPPNTIPYLASEGITVSPAYRVYSAVNTDSYVLLSSQQWGNCTTSWPSGYSTKLPYSSANCQSLCKANYFNTTCGCSPFTYNIDQSFTVCTPYQTIQCYDQNIKLQGNNSDSLNMPKCMECKVECNRMEYHAYNSYGYGFSNAALKWLSSKNINWTRSYIRNNFLTLNVFFRDMSFTEYRQVQATSLTEVLSDIGGNMGMFLGMSLMTVVETVIYLSKISWIALSKKRRDYLLEKKKREEEHEHQLRETVSKFSLFRNRKISAMSSGSMSHTRAKIDELRRNMRISRDTEDGRKMSMISKDSMDQKEIEKNIQRDRFMNEYLDHQLYGTGRADDRMADDASDDRPSIIELKIDANELRERLGSREQAAPIHPAVARRGRRRASTEPSPIEYKEGERYTWNITRE